MVIATQVIMTFCKLESFEAIPLEVLSQLGAWDFSQTRAIIQWISFKIMFLNITKIGIVFGTLENELFLPSFRAAEQLGASSSSLTRVSLFGWNRRILSEPV